jgi:hypothetical protein
MIATLLSLMEKDLHQVKLKQKLAKYDKFQESVTFLGHVVNQDGINMDPEKVKAMSDCYERKCLKDVKAI